MQAFKPLQCHELLAVAKFCKYVVIANQVLAFAVSKYKEDFIRFLKECMAIQPDFQFSSLLLFIIIILILFLLLLKVNYLN